MLRPPKYLRHKGRNLGYCRVDGRQRYFHGAWDSAESRSAYDAFLDAWLQKHDPKRSVATIGQLCLEYARYADATYRKHGEPTGVVNNIRSALKLLLRTHRYVTVWEISLPMLVKWRDSLIGRPDSRFKRRGRTISRQYINRCTKIVLRMLRWARQKGVRSPKLPTSLDHLAPDDAILQATLQLRMSPKASAHSIIGTGHRQLDGSDGDGIVAVSSARIAGVDSELFVEASHREIHHDDETIAIVRRILLQSYLASSTTGRDRSSGVRHLDKTLGTLKQTFGSGGMSVEGGDRNRLSHSFVCDHSVFLSLLR